MIEYKFRGKGSDGRTVVGRVLANSTIEAYDSVTNREITPISIKRLNVIAQFWFFLRVQIREALPIKKRNIKLFCFQMSLLLRANVAAEEAVLQLANSVPSKAMRAILQKVHKRLLEGWAFSKAFEGFPRAFPPLYIGFLRQAEQVGNLTEIFKQIEYMLSVTSQYSRELLLYIMPQITVAIFILLVSVILSKTMFPYLVSALEIMDRPIPMSVKTMMLAANFLTSPQILIGFLVFIGTVLLYRRLSKLSSIQYGLEWCYLQIPYIKTLVRLSAIQYLTKILLLAMENNMPLQDAIRVAASVLPNVVLKQHVLMAADKLDRGESLLKALEESVLFSEFEMQLLDVGGRSGYIKESIQRLNIMSVEYIEFVVILVKEITRLFMYLLIAFLAGFLVIAVYSAVINVYF
ncbi:MAG: type IV pilin biogenesis protein [marine bacterium B5-7]|nr:MAG: type IV pilin biogenesis protein [marine bacterium B5-7]